MESRCVLDGLTHLHHLDVSSQIQRLGHGCTSNLIWVKPGAIATTSVFDVLNSIEPVSQVYLTGLSLRSRLRYSSVEAGQF